MGAGMLSEVVTARVPVRRWPPRTGRSRGSSPCARTRCRSGLRSGTARGPAALRPGPGGLERPPRTNRSCSRLLRRGRRARPPRYAADEGVEVAAAWRRSRAGRPRPATGSGTSLTSSGSWPRLDDVAVDERARQRARSRRERSCWRRPSRLEDDAPAGVSRVGLAGDPPRAIRPTMMLSVFEYSYRAPGVKTSGWFATQSMILRRARRSRAGSAWNCADEALRTCV